MTTIIGVRFKSNGKMYYFDPQGLEIAPGTGVIVETARGVEYGDCVQGNTDVPDQQVVQPLKRVVRVATCCFTSPQTAAWTSANWLRTLRACSVPALSCARSACAMRRR